MPDGRERRIFTRDRWRHGPVGVIGRFVLRRFPYLRGLLFGQFSPRSPASYRAWTRRYDTLSDAERAAIAAHAAALPAQTIGLVMPVGRASLPDLPGAVASLRDQLYPHWRLVIAADPAIAAEARASLTPDATGRVTVTVVPDGDLLPLTSAPFVALLSPDTRLAPQALYELAATLAAHPDTDLVYTDEDRLDVRGRRRAPQFKPDWSPDLLLGTEALGDLAVVRRSAVQRAGGIGDPAARHDRALRLADAIAPERIRHIPVVLAHRRAPDGPGPADAAAVARHLARRGVAGARVEPNARLAGTLRVCWPVPEPAPTVSVIVPTRDHANLLARCAEGVLRRTAYPDLELLIVDNGSEAAETHALFRRLAADPRVRLLPQPGPFNYAALNNAAAAAARGAVLVLLNNDVDVIGPGWLAELVGHAMRPDVGAVGARLLFADGRLQHGGVALGVSGVAGHTDLLAARGAPGYGGRLALVHDVAAVTGACLAIRRAVFEAVGGMDAAHLAVAYNDVDLCLRVRERGWRVVWTPFAELFHHESASRPSDLSATQKDRFEREIAYMHRRWGTVLLADPFYNPNFSLRDGHSFLASPRRPHPWQAANLTTTRAATQAEASVLAGS